jgi:hypothetical protein
MEWISAPTAVIRPVTPTISEVTPWTLTASPT